MAEEKNLGKVVPEKGVDYFTEQEKQEMIEEASSISNIEIDRIEIFKTMQDGKYPIYDMIRDSRYYAPKRGVWKHGNEEQLIDFPELKSPLNVPFTLKIQSKPINKTTVNLINSTTKVRLVLLYPSRHSRTNAGPLEYKKGGQNCFRRNFYKNEDLSEGRDLTCNRLLIPVTRDNIVKRGSLYLIKITLSELDLVRLMINELQSEDVETVSDDWLIYYRGNPQLDLERSKKVLGKAFLNFYQDAPYPWVLQIRAKQDMLQHTDILDTNGDPHRIVAANSNTPWAEATQREDILSLRRLLIPPHRLTTVYSFPFGSFIKGDGSPASPLHLEIKSPFFRNCSKELTIIGKPDEQLEHRVSYYQYGQTQLHGENCLIAPFLQKTEALRLNLKHKSFRAGNTLTVQFGFGILKDNYEETPYLDDMFENRFFTNEHKLVLLPTVYLDKRLENGQSYMTEIGVFKWKFY